jgi:hypothetical protein
MLAIYLRVLEVTELSSFSGAANMKEALEISGSLALAGNELLEQRLELVPAPGSAAATNL